MLLQYTTEFGQHDNLEETMPWYKINGPQITNFLLLVMWGG